MGLSPALLRELTMKKFMKTTKNLQWEEEKRMERHKARLSGMKPAIDNNLPNQGPRKALEQKKERIWQNRSQQLETENMFFLTRLRQIKHRKPGTLWRRKTTGLMRGDSFKLQEPKLHKTHGNLDPPFQSTKKVQDRVVQKAVDFQGMDEEGERWLRRWISRDKDVPIDILDYAKSSPLPSVRSMVVTPPPPRGNNGQPLPFIEPEAEDLVPRAAKLSLKDEQTEMSPRSPRTPLWQWDATDRSPGSSWASSSRSMSRYTTPRTRTPRTPRTSASAHRWSVTEPQIPCSTPEEPPEPASPGCCGFL